MEFAQYLARTLLSWRSSSNYPLPNEPPRETATTFCPYTFSSPYPGSLNTSILKLDLRD